jgi:arylsulfatase A-like enzyme
MYQTKAIILTFNLSGNNRKLPYIFSIWFASLLFSLLITVSPAVSQDVDSTRSIVLGDIDGDGDLDIIAGNGGDPAQFNRLYLNTGTADPFNGVAGTDIGTDAYHTRSTSLGDIDGDGDLDIVAANRSQVSRLYLNNGTVDPFNGVPGTDIGVDNDYTRSISLGDMDGDGDLDVVTGNSGQTNRLYLNDGTADPFIGISGTDISLDGDNSRSIMLGDVDGDGDLDVVAGNAGQANRLYLNNDTADPFNGVSGTDISTDVDLTYAIALGDVDGDGDLDVVAGNAGLTNRLYLNNGTANPFSGIAGTDIGTDVHYTVSIALGDMDGDGDLDVVAGNHNSPNRIHLNNGTADPFNPVTAGTVISLDADATNAISLGDMDGDGDLDVVAGNYNQANRLYLNNGTADPFSGVTGTDIGTNIEDSIILWIVIDTLRADHLGSYGYPRNTTPYIDQIAMNGIRFETTISTSPWTLPSFSTMLTGMTPKKHGMLHGGDYYTGAEEMVAEILKRNGFRTASFQRNTFISDNYGILRGFDSKQSFYGPATDANLSTAVINWLQQPENVSGKTFLFLGYLSPHDPYYPPKNILRQFSSDGLGTDAINITCEDLVTNSEYWTQGSLFSTETYPWINVFYPDCVYSNPPGNFDPNLWINAYDGDIKFDDIQIARLITYLKRSGLWDRTFLIITGDHGEMLAEKKNAQNGTILPFDHGGSLDEGVIHVPLIMRAPSFRSGIVINKPVSTLDLSSTVLDYAGLNTPAYMQSQSLLPLIMNQTSQNSSFVYSYQLKYTQRIIDTAEFASIRGVRYKLVQYTDIIGSGGTILYFYDLNRDPWEENNLSGDPSYAPLISVMNQQLNQWLQN